MLRPFARRLSEPVLWRMTHRSVPRGVALGLGIGVIIPFMHTFIAAVLAIPLRANVAMAAAFTLVVNPITIPPMYYAAYRIGSGNCITIPTSSIRRRRSAFPANLAGSCSGFITRPAPLHLAS